MNTFANLMWLAFFGVLAVQFGRCIRLVPTRKAYIVERLGKYQRRLGPGLHVLLPFIDKVAFIQDLKEESIEVPPQECFTSDNVRVEVDGVIYISVVNPENASYGITDYRYAAVQLAQTTTRSVIGTLELDRTFEEREAINSRVVGVLSEVGDAWGIRVHRYEVKNIVPPASVRDAMERQMGAERERRALLARSEGQKESRINEAEGRKEELINHSEGEKQRRINEAEGRAQEILALANATSESIRKMGDAMIQPGGDAAVQLQLSQKHLSQLQHLAAPEKRVVLPSDLSRMDDWLAAVGLTPVPKATQPHATTPVTAPKRGAAQPPNATVAPSQAQNPAQSATPVPQVPPPSAAPVPAVPRGNAPVGTPSQSGKPARPPLRE